MPELLNGSICFLAEQAVFLKRFPDLLRGPMELLIVAPHLLAGAAGLLIGAADSLNQARRLLIGAAGFLNRARSS